LIEHGAPDTFIHLGWGDVYQPHSEEHLTTNLQNGINLVDEFFDHGVDRFVLIGSVSEYGNRFGPMTEDLTAEGPVSNYVNSKIALSQYGLNAAERYKKIFIHIRLFNTYGTYMDEKDGRVITNFLYKIKNLQSIQYNY
jgi:nucleoside-diphosphate-sugar epimerase